MIKKCEVAWIKNLNDPSAFIEYSNTIDDVYNNIDEYSPRNQRKILIVFDDRITQSYFSVPKEVRLNSTHYLIMKTHNKRELQQIAINHSADIDYEDFLRIYRNCAKEPYSFSTIDTTLPAHNPMRCRKSFSDSLLYK